MSDPELIDRIFQTCSYRFRNVLCPNNEKVAKIAANKLQMEDNAEWTVIEVLPDARRRSKLRHELFVERDRTFPVGPPNRDLAVPAVARLPFTSMLGQKFVSKFLRYEAEIGQPRPARFAVMLC